MTFKEVIPTGKPKAAPVLAAKVRCTPGRGVTVLLNENLRAELGWIAGTTRLRLLVGAAESEGRIRLLPDDGAPLLLGGIGQGGAVLHVGFWPELAAEKLKATHVEWTIIAGDNALELALPDALQRPRVGGPVRAAAPLVDRRILAPRAEARSTPAPARNLTASLMGDPAPGRSAADQARDLARDRPKPGKGKL